VLRSSFVVSALVVSALSTNALAERLADVRVVGRGDYLQPQFSPDGSELLVTGPQLRGLAVLSRTGVVRTVTDEPEAGVHASWTSSGIHYRAQRAGVRRDLAITPSGATTTIAAATQLAFAKDDRMYVVDRTSKLVKVGSGDRFFGAVIAPDGDKVVFQGLTTGLYLYVRSTGALRYIGPGTAPAWSPDSKRLAYEVTEDDGHTIVASDIYVYTVATDRAEPVTATDALIERRPSFSPTGAEIAFDDNTGGILVGRLEVK
jgi:Tol biopolymer transport system component